MEIKPCEMLLGITFSPRARQALLQILEMEHRQNINSEPFEEVINCKDYPCITDGCYEKTVARFYKLFSKWAVVIYKKYGNKYSETETGSITDFDKILFFQNYAFEDTVSLIKQYLQKLV